jgi:hypothetical protein
VAPVLVGFVGAALGVLAALLIHWFVVQPSDAELRDVAETLTPSKFTAIHEPVVTGSWLPSLTRGVVRVSAATPRAATVGEIADGLRADGWALPDDVDAGAGEGWLRATRDGLVVTVDLRQSPAGPVSTAGISVSRGPQARSLTIATMVGGVAGAVIGSGAVVVVRGSRAAAGSTQTDDA